MMEILMLILKVDPINYHADGTIDAEGNIWEMHADAMKDGILVEAELDLRSTHNQVSHFRVVVNNIDIGYVNVNTNLGKVDLYTLEPIIGEKAFDKITLSVKRMLIDAIPL